MPVGLVRLVDSTEYFRVPAPLALTAGWSAPTRRTPTVTAWVEVRAAGPRRRETCRNIPGPHNETGLQFGCKLQNRSSVTVVQSRSRVCSTGLLGSPTIEIHWHTMANETNLLFVDPFLRNKHHLVPRIRVTRLDALNRHLTFLLIFKITGNDLRTRMYAMFTGASCHSDHDLNLTAS